jgi:hypothetical protein
MNTLFELPEEIKKVMRAEKCKTCKHLDWIEYESGRKIFYCNKRYSHRTENKKLKIKANGQACEIFKRDTNMV